MSEPFLALFTNSEVFLSLLEGLVLRPLLFDFPRSTIQTERLNNWTVSKLFLQRLQMEEVYMASLIYSLYWRYTVFGCCGIWRSGAKKSMENVWTVLIRGLECADKSCILPKQKNSFPE